MHAVMLTTVFNAFPTNSDIEVWQHICLTELLLLWIWSPNDNVVVNDENDGDEGDSEDVKDNQEGNVDNARYHVVKTLSL